MGAVLGAAQFVLAAGGDWRVLRIPEWQRDRAPDLLAVPAKGGAWRVEVKATGPLSFSLPCGATMDLCDHMYARRRAAWEQLDAKRLPPFVGAPLIAAAGPNPQNPLFSRGGGAVAIEALPDAAFALRQDIRHLGRRACPRGSSRCVDDCLHNGTPHGVRTVGLILGEPGQFGGGGKSPALGWEGVVSAAAAATNASWSGASVLGDAALRAVGAETRRLSRLEAFREREREAVLRLVGGVLKETRGLSTPSIRTEVVESVAELVEEPEEGPFLDDLWQEAVRGVPEVGRRFLFPLPALRERTWSDLEDPSVEYHVEIGGQQYAGRRFGRELRLASVAATSATVLGEVVREDVEKQIIAALWGEGANQRFVDATVSAELEPREDEKEGREGRWSVGRFVDHDAASAWLSQDGRLSIYLP